MSFFSKKKEPQKVIGPFEVAFLCECGNVIPEAGGVYPRKTPRGHLCQECGQDVKKAKMVSGKWTKILTTSRWEEDILISFEIAHNL